MLCDRRASSVVRHTEQGPATLMNHGPAPWTLGRTARLRPSWRPSKQLPAPYAPDRACLKGNDRRDHGST